MRCGLALDFSWVQQDGHPHLFEGIAIENASHLVQALASIFSYEWHLEPSGPARLDLVDDLDCPACQRDRTRYQFLSVGHTLQGRFICPSAHGLRIILQAS